MTIAPVEHVDVDVAVVGSGFGGALTAQSLRALGRSVALLERGRHPRFAIGESSTPLANLLLEELADRYTLPHLRPLSKWGTWQRAYPGIGCGLKRGFTFYQHGFDASFDDDHTHDRQLLVAASPRDEVADTHWYRPDIDQLLVEQAIEAGAIYVDELALDAPEIGNGCQRLRGERHGRAVRVTSRFLVDASGPRGYLHRMLHLPERPHQWLPHTHGLYAHFTGVTRWDALHQETETPPYPVDDAAVHHVFDGGWIWVLRFANGITSAGAAVTGTLARDLRLADGAAGWERLLARLPSVRECFAGARPVTAFVHGFPLAFRSGRVHGPGWALLPSAAGVVDPLLSTGFPLTLLGIGRLVEQVHRSLDGASDDGGMARYAAQTDRELDATEHLVGALYASMGDFALFKRLTLLYFAAASFSETVRRLGRGEQAGSFLLCDHPAFGPGLRACADAALAHPTGATREELLQDIETAIGPFDVAGLRDRSRRDWYPMLVEDLLRAAPSLGTSDDELLALVARCGLAPPEPTAGFAR